MTYCCEKCPHWGTCETKWYRGERGEEQYCCDRCPFFSECNPELRLKSPVKKGRKKKK
ncbi:MAG: hypothetical protein ABIL44_07440 [candidate division WOR-3 bacterium]